jgi:hypothetical protein
VTDGFDPWLDEEKLLPGLRWKEVISMAVRESDIVIICLSRNSISKAGFVQREIKFALDIALEQPEGTNFLIPLKLEECDVPNSLIEWHWVNLFEDNGYERLMKALSHRASGLNINLQPLPQKSDDKPSSKRVQNKDLSKSKSSVELPTSEDEHGVKILPLAIGIETLGGIFTKLVPEGTPLPYRHTEIFSTASDNQSSVEVHILVGLRPQAMDNLSVGKFHLVGIPRAPRGIPQIKVTFDIDASGVVAVSAIEMSTGRQKQIIVNSFGPSKEEIDRIMRDARSHSAKDAWKREEEDARQREETEASNREGEKSFQEIFEDLFGKGRAKQ